MALWHTGYETNSVRFQSDLEASAGDVLGATARQTITELPIPAARRMLQLADAQGTGTRLEAQTARQRIIDSGLDGRLTVPDSGITEPALNILMERKREEIKRQEVMSRAPKGVGMAAAQLGTAFATSMLDPLNVGLAFVPIVGEARYMRYLANARGALGRTGVRAGVGAAEGAAGAAMVEPLVYAAKTQEQADYDFQDSLLNIAFGTIFGGGLHTVAGASADAFRRATGKVADFETLRGVQTDDDVRFVQNLRREIDRGMDPRDVETVLGTFTPEARKVYLDNLPKADSAAVRVAELPLDVRESALRTAIGQAMRGKQVKVESFAIDADPFDVRPAIARARTDSDMQARLLAMKNETGWEEEGGQLLRASNDFNDPNYNTIVGRTQWLPRADWWPDRPDAMSAKAVEATIDKAVAGGKLNAKERRMIEYLVNVADERRKLAEYLPTDEDMRADGLSGIDSAYEAAMVTRATELDEATVERLAMQYGDDDAGFLKAIKGFLDDNEVSTAPQPRQANQGSARAQAAAEEAKGLDSPESDLTADVPAARAADEQLANAPSGPDELAIQEAMLADELADLQEVAKVAGIDLKAELEEFDEAIALADTYSKAARAAVLCGLGH